MAKWREFEKEAPALAADVMAAFTARRHATMATLRADGSPRISGTEVAIEKGQVRIGSMLDAVKARDLRRDPRVSIHSPTFDPPVGDDKGWPGEAKLSGRAVEGRPRKDSHAFHIDIDEVVHTRLTPEGDALWIRSWHPGRGVEERRRT